MHRSEPYEPASIFLPDAVDGAIVPRVFISPQRYIQGPGVIDSIGRYLRLVNVRRVAILISDRICPELIVGGLPLGLGASSKVVNPLWLNLWSQL